MIPHATTADGDCLRIRFGSADADGIAVEMPALDGDSVESLFPTAVSIGSIHGMELFRCGDWLLGRAGLPGGVHLEASAHRIYTTLLEASRGHHLARIWNYVPAINDHAIEGLENYRAFCRGRSIAFEEAYGADFKRHAPAASAVGCGGPNLVVVFAAHTRAARYLENPWQVPAYEYPEEHGPRSPTFARASEVDLGDGTHAVFISGTAAIRGHATVAPSTTAPQMACTMENLREISRTCGLGSDLGEGRCALRHAKVYVRHAEDLPVVREIFESEFTRPGDQVSYLQADICRHELNVEIELSVFGARLQ